MSARVEIGGSAADPDYVFYNATIINNSQQTTSNVDDPTLVFQDTRETPLVKDASQYVVSVENFTLNGVTKTLPVFIPQIQANQSDPNLTIYTVSFGLRVLSTSAIPWVSQVTETVVWEPELVGNGLYVPAPTTAIPRQAESPYYYCYTYSHWCRLMNKALAKAWAKVIDSYQVAVAGVAGVGPYNSGTAGTLKGAAISLFPATLCPFFEFDPTTQLFSLCQDSQSSTFFGQSATAVGGTAYPETNPAGLLVVETFGPYSQRTHANSAVGTVAATSDSGTVETTTVNPHYLNEFSYVGYNSNLEGLISNFDTRFYGSGTTWQTANLGGYGGSLTALSVPENIVLCQPDQQYYNSNIFKLVDPRTGEPFVHGTTNLHYRIYCRETQDFSSTGTLWSPVSSLVIVTSMLPVRNEVSSSPITYGSGNLGTTGGSSGGFNKILIETPIDVKNAADWRDMITYEPKVATYTSLTSSQEPIQNIDLRVYWRNRLTNALIPLQAYNSGNMNLRLLFKRKDAL